VSLKYDAGKLSFAWKMTASFFAKIKRFASSVSEV
jgi:hypothetical protein